MRCGSGATGVVVQINTRVPAAARIPATVTAMTSQRAAAVLISRFILVSNLRGSSTLRALRRLNHALKAAVWNEPHQCNENVNAACELGREKGRDNAHEI